MVNLDDVFGHGDLHAVAWFEASPSALPIRETSDELSSNPLRMVHDFDA